MFFDVHAAAIDALIFALCCFAASSYENAFSTSLITFA
jgi:hypothetical protein